MALILLVEDDPTQRLANTAMLERDGHDVVAAPTAEEALSLAVRVRPDLLVCDVQLPGMSGVELVQLLKGNRELLSMPVLMLTSMDSRHDMRAGMSAGADDYLTKPASGTELRAAVTTLLNKRKRLREHDTHAVEKQMAAALTRQKEALAEQYEARLLHELNLRWEQPGRDTPPTQLAHAHLLLTDLFGALAGRGLADDALAQAVRQHFERSRDVLLLFHARYILPAGNQLLAVFDGDATLALRAAQGLRTGLPDATVALHAGPLTLMHVTDALHGGPASTLASGDTLLESEALLAHGRQSGWPLVASHDFLHALPPRSAGIGAGGALELPTRAGALMAAELLPAPAQ